MKIAYLKQTDIFAGISDVELHEIAASLRMTNFAKGALVYRPEDAGDVVFILKTGRVRLFRLGPDGRELTLDELCSGTIFGEMALFGQSMYGSFAQALEDSLICIVSRQAAISLLETRPSIALRLAEVLGRRLLSAQNRIESLGLKDVSRRLASVLLELDGSAGGCPGIDRKYTHEELAKMIGASRESVTITFGEFKSRGWLETKNRVLELTDIAALREHAG